MSKMKSYIFDLFDDNKLTVQNSERIQDAEFWTTDRDAYLSFGISRQGFVINKAIINLYNKSDKTLLIDEPMTILNNEARFKMPSDVMSHFGKWSVQVIFNDVYTSPAVDFDILRALGSGIPDQIGLIHEWEKLNNEVKAFVAEIEGFTLEEFVALKMGEELANLEVNYAKRLTGLERKDNELAAQLAQSTTDLLERGVNVKNFGAVGDGVTDDTIAIQNAIDYTSSHILTNRPSGGITVGAIPTIIFPRGRYLVSDEIVYNAYSKILSHDGAIIEQITVGKNIFTCDDAFNINVVGMNFVKGKHAFRIANQNINQSVFNFVNCSFQLQESYSVMTESNHATYTNLSANLTFDKCSFRNPNKVLHNVCDSAIMNDCWVQISGNNFTPDSAVFMNAEGRLFFYNLFTVPDNVGVVDRARWIDAYDDIYATNCRFGGEDGGIPIIYFLGDRVWEQSGNRIGAAIVLKDSWLYCGTDSNPLEGVIHPITSIPSYIKVEGCELVGPLINNSNNIDFSTYFENQHKRGNISYRFDIEENLFGVGGSTLTSIPKEMMYFTRTGIRPSTDIPNGIELGNNRSFELVDGDILGGLSFSSLDTTSGASGTRAKFYAEVKGTAGQTDLVFEVATNNGKPREVLRITHDGKLLVNGVEIT